MEYVRGVYVGSPPSAPGASRGHLYAAGLRGAQQLEDGAGKKQEGSAEPRPLAVAEPGA